MKYAEKLFTGRTHALAYQIKSSKHRKLKRHSGRINVILQIKRGMGGAHLFKKKAKTVVNRIEELFALPFILLSVNHNFAVGGN